MRLFYLHIFPNKVKTLFQYNLLQLFTMRKRSVREQKKDVQDNRSTYDQPEGEDKQKLSSIDDQNENQQLIKCQRFLDYFQDDIIKIQLQGLEDYSLSSQMESQGMSNYQDLNQNIEQNQQTESNQGSVEVQKAQTDPVFKNVFKKASLRGRNGNIIRLLVDLAITYFPQFKQQFGPDQYDHVVKQCRNYRNWHLEHKKNVYILEDLIHLIGNKFQDEDQCPKKLRRIFSQIIQKYTLTAMKRPRSQIKDKVFYLKVVKVYNLRCRNNSLIRRLQSR